MTTQIKPVDHLEKIALQIIGPKEIIVYTFFSSLTKPGHE